MKLYQELAGRFQAYQNCIKSNNQEWEEKHRNRIEILIDSLPHGSGIDGRTTFDFKRSSETKIVINSSFHVMDENGFYDGWIDFSLILEPSWNDIELIIKGKFGKHQDLKEYILDIFYEALNQEVIE